MSQIADAAVFVKQVVGAPLLTAAARGLAWLKMEPFVLPHSELLHG